MPEDPWLGRCSRPRRPGGGKALERGDGRLIDPAVDPGGTEVALNRLDHELGAAVDAAGRLDTVAIVSKQALHLGKQRTGGADTDARLRFDQRRGRHPMADAAGGQSRPRKLLARIDLAPGG